MYTYTYICIHIWICIRVCILYVYVYTVFVYIFVISSEFWLVDRLNVKQWICGRRFNKDFMINYRYYGSKRKKSFTHGSILSMVSISDSIDWWYRHRSVDCQLCPVMPLRSRNGKFFLLNGRYSYERVGTYCTCSKTLHVAKRYVTKWHGT